METTVMTPRKTKLPNPAPSPAKHNLLLHIPMSLWSRMIKEGGLTWGTVTKFILEAITEKLDRMKKEAKQ